MGGEALELRTVIDRAALWTTDDYSASDLRGSYDGPYWIFEARSSRGYRVVTKIEHRVPENEVFMAFGRFALRVADLSLENAFEP